MFLVDTRFFCNKRYFINPDICVAESLNSETPLKFQKKAERFYSVDEPATSFVEKLTIQSILLSIN